MAIKKNLKMRESVGLESSIGKNIYVEVPLPDGAHRGEAGTLIEVTVDEIILSPAVYVDHTGRRWKFYAGDFDSDTSFEPYPPGTVVRLPRWGAIVTDWPYEIPTEAK